MTGSSVLARWRSAARVSLLLAVGAGSAVGQSPPPDADWRTLETEHFRVTFTPALEPLARQAGAVAERSYEILARELVEPPAGVIDIVVTDHADVSNGFAFSFPSNRIVVYARPSTEPQLAFARDWMELLVAHELVHVFHLDDTGPVGAAVRAVLGRVPMVWPLFPGVGSPTWNVEGLATHFESRLTGSGRVPGSFHEMIVRTAAIEGTIPDLDRVSAPHPAWPGGHRSYAYGGRLMRYIADRYGPDAHRRILDATGGSILPTFLAFDHVAEEALGRPFDDLYDEWRADETARARRLADRLRATGLTRTEPVAGSGPFASAPRVSPDGSRLSYGAHDYRSDPATRVVDLGTGADRVLARRNGGGTLLGPAAWLPDGDGMVVAQLELDGPYRIRSDLWRVGLDGRERRLTVGARLAQPDVAGDGRIVAVRERAGARDLVIHDPTTGTTEPVSESEPGDAWDGPRWSPDGRRIAAGRLRGGRVDVVVVDAATGRVRSITDDDALDLAPTWSPDGRWLVWWSDRSGIPSILAAEPGGPEAAPGPAPRPRQLTRVLTGAFDPEIAAGWLYVSVYHDDGWRIERLPFDPAGAPAADGGGPTHEQGLLPEPGPAGAVRAGSNASRYSPWSTLRPRFWVPEWERLDGAGGSLSFPGLSTWGEDLVTRHEWELGAGVDVRTGRVQGRVVWTYRGLGNPILTARLRRDWSRVTDRHFDDGVTESFYRRTDELSLNAMLWRLRWRSRAWLRLSAEAEWRETEAYDMGDRELAVRDVAITPLPTLVGVSAGPGWTSARRHPFSISDQDGVTIALGLGRWWDVSDGGPGYDEVSGQVAGYLGIPLWGFADHVVAGRVRALARWGDHAPIRSIGGVPGGADPLGTGGGAAYGVRGFDSGDRWGTRAWIASAEWRFPIHMTAPPGAHVLGFSLTAISGTLFADAGHAWCGETEREGRLHPCADRSADPLASVGAELTVDFGALHNDRFVLRAGVALPVRGPGEGDPAAYVAFGPSF